jgi:hypothetical protein
VIFSPSSSPQLDRLFGVVFQDLTAVRTELALLRKGFGYPSSDLSVEDQDLPGHDRKLSQAGADPVAVSLELDDSILLFGADSDVSTFRYGQSTLVSTFYEWVFECTKCSLACLPSSNAQGINDNLVVRNSVSAGSFTGSCTNCDIAANPAIVSIRAAIEGQPCLLYE